MVTIPLPKGEGLCPPPNTTSDIGRSLMLFAELTGEVTVLENVLTPSPQNSFFAGTRYHTRVLSLPDASQLPALCLFHRISTISQRCNGY
ncbi:hypothetical protein [Scytonema sp. PCC 10023]|uniref:hypothetical protein n=1 Tax=Scytonema sp. PCC 10023 TaxID=1680591 RepID=UPI0039C5CD32